MPLCFAVEYLEGFGEPLPLSTVGFLCSLVRLDGRMDRLGCSRERGDSFGIHAPSESQTATA